MRALHSLLAIFAEGQEYIEALGAVVADKVVGGHKAIVTESGAGVERDVIFGYGLHRQYGILL